jgi:tripartite-type tricarboxylate transporter receptor subunit TctC
MCRLIIALILTLAIAQTHAQDAWPAKPVKLIVPSSPGGGTDAYARIIAQALTEATKQQFVVDNRPGASGGIGAQAVAKSPPDGYTLLISANAAIAINPALYKSLPFDAERDFVPVTRGVMAPMVIAAYPGAGYKTLGDLVEAGKRAPETIAYGSAGGGSPPYLGVRMLEEATGAKFVHVPYKGVGPAYVDLLAGRIKFIFTDLATVQQHIAAGKAVALAMNERTSLAPGVPSIADAGWPKVEMWTSFSAMAPAGTPAAVVARINEQIGAAMKIPAVAERLRAQALVPVFDTPAQFAAAIKAERELWVAFVRRNNITAEP